MDVGDYTLVNEEKVNRVIFGTLANDGSMQGGLGEDAEPEMIIANYDKLGGLIKKGEDTVKTGSFWDFKGKMPHKKPQVVFQYRINGEMVDVPEGVELPGKVKAARILAQRDAEESDEETPKKRGRKAKDDEDEA